MTHLAVLFVVLLGSCVVGNAQIPQTSPARAEESTECTQARVTVTRLEAWLRDWPDLGRYRDQNGQVKSPAKNEKRVVFMGDSITDSWDEPRYGAFFQAQTYVNRGISGQTTQQMLIRFRPDVIALTPQVVVILAGTNDIAGNTGPTTLEAIQDNLKSMVDLARVHKIRVVLASLLPVSDYEKTADGQQINQTIRRPPEKIKALNEWMKNYAAANKLTYLDYFSAMIDAKGFLQDELSNDGLHPNEKGYEVMGPLAQAAITRAIKGKM
jgi:lysophospholipase L1-like esterase